MKILGNLIFILCILIPLSWQQATCGHGISVRKEIGDLNAAELSNLIQVFQALKTDGTIDRFANMHDNFKNFAHGSSAFFSWHRAFLHSFEAEMKRVNPIVSLPYWDWSLDSQAPEKSMIFKPNYFGGNGEAPTYCIGTGPLKTWTFDGRCLTRRFDGGSVITAFASPEAIRSLVNTADDYDKFRLAVEYQYHSLVHIGIGGHMASMISPRDPIFYLHHAFVDKIWNSYQTKSNGIYLERYHGSVDSVLNPFGYNVKHVFNIVESLCYRYTDPIDPQNRAGISESEVTTTITTSISTTTITKKTTTNTPGTTTVSTTTTTIKTTTNAPETTTASTTTTTIKTTTKAPETTTVSTTTTTKTTTKPPETTSISTTKTTTKTTTNAPGTTTVSTTTINNPETTTKMTTTLNPTTTPKTTTMTGNPTTTIPNVTEKPTTTILNYLTKSETKSTLMTTTIIHLETTSTKVQTTPVPTSSTMTTYESPLATTTITTKSYTPIPTINPIYDMVCKTIEKHVDLSKTDEKNSKLVPKVNADTFPKANSSVLMFNVNNEAGANIEIPVPGAYNRDEKKLMRVPAQIPEHYLIMHGYQVPLVRSLELQLFDMILRYNNATISNPEGFTSTAAIQNVNFKDSKVGEKGLGNSSDKKLVGIVDLENSSTTILLFGSGFLCTLVTIFLTLI